MESLDIKIIDKKTKFENNVCATNLITWAKKCKNLIVHDADTPIKNVILQDIKLNKRNEDEVYLTDDDVFERIRRGNCVISYTDKGEKVSRVARKGLKKFFDYKINYKNNKEEKKMKERVLSPIKYSFDKKGKIYVYSTEKANGENIQIAYDTFLKSWVIGSKNVTMLCRTKDDITWYRYNTQNSQRYSYCLEFAQLWLDIVDKKITSQNKFEEFINDINGYTLVGENVGDMNHQHIKIYNEKDIVFYAMIKNDSDEYCESIEKSEALLRDKYKLNYVEIKKSPLLNTFEEFLTYTNKLYEDILLKNIEVAGEGAVVYFARVDGKQDEEIVSMGKLKTFEYRFLRKLREKLKSFEKKGMEILLKNIEKESNDILGENGDDVDLTEYMKFAVFVFNYVKNAKVKRDYSNFYATFINIPFQLFFNIINLLQILNILININNFFN